MTIARACCTVQLAACLAYASSLHGDDRSFRVVERKIDPLLGPEEAVLELAIAGEDDSPVPARVVLAGAGGGLFDGSGRGVYRDGSFFVDGGCEATVAPGTVRVAVTPAPFLLPASGDVELAGGERAKVRISIARWLDAPAGWYAGDHHVHARHDLAGEVRSDLAYAALQARAAGLDWMNEAGSHADYGRVGDLSRPDFLFGHADELRPGPFAGHLIPLGITEPIPAERARRASGEPLPALVLVRAAAERGGVAIHTHPLTPPHQAHWMGAAEIVSDAVRGETAAGLDIDSRACEVLWGALVELGARVAACGSTDAALGRARTRRPGERRTWVRADSLDWESIAGAIRAGRTMASSGGPLFLELEAGGSGPGGTAALEADGRLRVALDLRTLRPLRRVELIGGVDHVFNAAGRSGDLRLEATVTPRPGARWLAARVEDEHGDWMLTSAVRLAAGEGRRDASGTRSAIVLSFSNATRFIELRREFFLHATATVGPGASIEEAELLRDGRTLRRLIPEDGDRHAAGVAPVTGAEGEYALGWVWHRDGDDVPWQLRLDHPLEKTGWYRLAVRTASSERIESDALWFDASFDRSHTASTVELRGPGVEFAWQGYGEEMALDAFQLPFAGDHWWFPENTAWRVRARLAGVLRGVASPRRTGAVAVLPHVRSPVFDEAPAPVRERLDLLAVPELEESLYTWLLGTAYRDPRGVFRLDRHAGGAPVLAISGEVSGYLGTLGAYRDYRLVLEFRWGERNHGWRIGKARDAGLFLHATGPDGNSHDGNGAFRSAIECQIMEGAVGDLMLIRGNGRDGNLVPLSLTAETAAALDTDGWPTMESGGRERTIRGWGRINRAEKDAGWRDVFGYRDEAGHERPAGEWNRLEVTCEGDRIEVRLNGTRVHKASKVQPSGGQVLLQSEGSELEVRRWELLPLEVGR